MVELSETQVTDSELLLIRKYSSILGHLQALLTTRQEAINDIVGLILSLRGLNLNTHDVLLDGKIIPKESVKQEQP